MRRTILFLNHPSKIGGAERSLLLLFKGLDNERFNPVLVCPADGPLIAEAQKLGVTVHPIKFFSLTSPKLKIKALLAFYKWVRSLGIDLIHCNSMALFKYAVALGILFSKPIVMHIRDIRIPDPMKFALRVFKNRAFFVANSEITRMTMLKMGLVNEKTEVVVNAVDSEAFNPDVFGEGFREDLKLREKDFLVGFVGRVDVGKGCFEFVEAAKILENCQEMKWVMVGDSTLSQDPELLEKLKKRVREQKLINFHFTGFREDIPQIMKALDVLVVPSEYESFGRVVIEAMSVGTPVVGSRTGGIAEILEDGKSGLLVPVKNSQAIAGAVKRLYTDRGLRKVISEEGLREVARRYTLEVQMRKIERIYTELFR